MPRFFYRAWPGSWRDLIAELVLVGGWSPRDAWALTDIDLEFWRAQAERLAREDE